MACSRLRAETRGLSMTMERRTDSSSHSRSMGREQCFAWGKAQVESHRHQAGHPLAMLGCSWVSVDGRFRCRKPPTQRRSLSPRVLQCSSLTWWPDDGPDLSRAVRRDGYRGATWMGHRSKEEGFAPNGAGSRHKGTCRPPTCSSEERRPFAGTMACRPTSIGIVNDS